MSSINHRKIIRHACHVIFGHRILSHPTQQQGHGRYPGPASGPGIEHVIHERRTEATAAPKGRHHTFVHRQRRAEHGRFVVDHGAELHPERVPRGTEEQEEPEHDRMRTGAKFGARGRDRRQTR